MALGCLSQSAWPRRADIDILSAKRRTCSLAQLNFFISHLCQSFSRGHRQRSPSRPVSSFSSPSIESPDPRFHLLSNTAAPPSAFILLHLALSPTVTQFVSYAVVIRDFHRLLVALQNQ